RKAHGRALAYRRMRLGNGTEGAAAQGRRRGGRLARYEHLAPIPAARRGDAACGGGVRSPTRAGVVRTEASSRPQTDGLTLRLWSRTRSPAPRVATSGFELPLLGSNQDSPDPMPLRLSPPLHKRSWSGLCLHLRP